MRPLTIKHFCTPKKSDGDEVTDFHDKGMFKVVGSNYINWNINWICFLKNMRNIIEQSFFKNVGKTYIEKKWDGYIHYWWPRSFL